MFDNTQQDIISLLINKNKVLSKTKYTINEEALEYLEEMHTYMPFDILCDVEEDIRFILKKDVDVLEDIEKELIHVTPLFSESDRIKLCFLHKEIYDYLDELMV